MSKPAAHERTVRAVLCPVFEPLTSAANIEAFKSCFRSIFLAHHALTGLGLVHGDISPANLLLYHTGTGRGRGRGDGNTDNDTGARPRDACGVLNDWDLAGSEMSEYRTGTHAFMATDLLKSSK